MLASEGVEGMKERIEAVCRGEGFGGVHDGARGQGDEG